MALPGDLLLLRPQPGEADYLSLMRAEIAVQGLEKAAVEVWPAEAIQARRQGYVVATVGMLGTLASQLAPINRMAWAPTIQRPGDAGLALAFLDHFESLVRVVPEQWPLQSFSEYSAWLDISRELLAELDERFPRGAERGGRLQKALDDWRDQMVWQR